MTDVLHVRRTVIGDAVVVHVVGEVDMTTAPQLECELERAFDQAGADTPLVVDLAPVSFLASAGLAALVRAHQRSLREGRSLRMVAAHRAVLRPIEVTGLDDVLDVVPTVGQAVGTVDLVPDAGHTEPPTRAGDGATAD